MNAAEQTDVKPFEQDQFAWHHKPAGWAGAPCPVCGCPAKRLLALHRALPAEESWKAGTLWQKCIKVCFGTDSSIESIHVNSDGDPVYPGTQIKVK